MPLRCRGDHVTFAEKVGRDWLDLGQESSINTTCPPYYLLQKRWAGIGWT